MASVSRILVRNLFPSPSPFDAPATSPAISTNSMTAGILFALFENSVSFATRSSGTGTIPTEGSMVQNG